MINRLTGYSNCAWGWMSDYKGYWYHTTAPGCGSGVGFRNGDTQTLLGAYCCNLATVIPKTYARSSERRRIVFGARSGGTSTVLEMQPEPSAYQWDMSVSATKPRLKAWAKSFKHLQTSEQNCARKYSYCAWGWLEDYKGYWYHETAQGCSSGAGYRNGDSQTLLGAYCCHDREIPKRTYARRPREAFPWLQLLRRSIYKGVVSARDSQTH